MSSHHYARILWQVLLIAVAMLQTTLAVLFFVRGGYFFFFFNLFCAFVVVHIFGDTL